MSTVPKVGPLTQTDLQVIWESTTDPSFWRPLEQAGEGNGFEAYTQAWAQFARVSQAIDTTTQAMFILPWSGQSAPPAAGAQLATTTLSISRTGIPSELLILGEGTLVQEQVPEWGDPVGVQVLSGRRYALTADLVFEPGEMGPLTVIAAAEKPGYGFNNPMIGTISVIAQPGTKFTNSNATVRGVNYPVSTITASSLARVFLDAIDKADAFVPEHVGQYIKFISGSNAGKIARIIGWFPPNLSLVPPTGGTVELELSQSIQSFTGHFAGTFQLGETLTLKNGATITGYGLLRDIQVSGGVLTLAFQKRVGSAVTTVVGNQSGATATIDVVLENLDLTPEVGSAEWLVLDWVVDWQVTCQNIDRPTGGRTAMLDALGKERNVFRAPGESDDSYRKRVSQLADVVTPNAVKRTLNRTIPGVAWCFREAGLPSYPGFFFDQDGFDNDGILLGSFWGDPVVGTFLPGEKVSQVGTDGRVAQGRALIRSPAVSSPPATPSAPAIVGISNIWGTFQPGIVCVGQTSGARVTPAIIRGGLMQANRYRVIFDYLHMRASFYVGLPNADAGDAGFAYDTHPHGGYDGIGYDDFYDGEPLLTNRRNLVVLQALNKVRAGGTVVEIYEAFDPCS